MTSRFDSRQETTVNSGYFLTDFAKISTVASKWRADAKKTTKPLSRPCLPQTEQKQYSTT